MQPLPPASLFPGFETFWKRTVMCPSREWRECGSGRSGVRKDLPCGRGGTRRVAGPGDAEGGCRENVSLGCTAEMFSGALPRGCAPEMFSGTLPRPRGCALGMCPERCPRDVPGALPRPRGCPERCPAEAALSRPVPRGHSATPRRRVGPGGGAAGLGERTVRGGPVLSGRDAQEHRRRREAQADSPAAAGYRTLPTGLPPFASAPAHTPGRGSGTGGEGQAASSCV